MRAIIALGDRLLLSFPSGRKEFTISGLFASAGLGDVFGGNLAIMDVYSAQFLFDRVGTFDRIDVLNAAGSDVETVRVGLKARLPIGLEVERPYAGPRTRAGMLVPSLSLAQLLPIERAADADKVTGPCCVGSPSDGRLFFGNMRQSGRPAT